MSFGRSLRGSVALLAFFAVASCSSGTSYPGRGGAVDSDGRLVGGLGPAKSLSPRAQPDTPETRAGLSTALSRAGNTATNSGNFSTAVKMYERAHKLAPDKIEPALGLARAASAIKDHERAAAAFRDAIEIDSNNADALSGLGRELMSLQEPRKAIPWLEKALRQRREAWVHNELGVAYEMVGDFPSALGEYQAGLELAPRDLTLRTNLGRALAWAGDYDAAVEILRVAATDPNATKKHRQVLSLVHALAGNVQSAAEITRVDFSQSEVDNKISYYRLIGDLARSDDRDAVAKVLADSALRSVGTNGAGDGRAVAFAARNRALSRTAERNTRSRPVLDDAGGSRLGTRSASAVASSKTVTASQPTRLSSRTKTAKVVKASASKRPRFRTEPPGAKGPFAYTVQLAAFRTPKRAEKGWRILKRAIPDILSPLGHMIRPPNPAFKWDRLFRLRTLAFVARGPAEQLCASINARGLECLVVQTKKVPGLAFEPFGTMAAIRDEGRKFAKAGTSARAGKKGAAASAVASSDASGDGKRNTSAVKRLASRFAEAITGSDSDSSKGSRTASAQAGAYQVQLAAYRTENGAKRGWRSLRKSVPDLLDSVGYTIIPPSGTGASASSLYRLRTAGVEDRLEAVRLCANLRARGVECIVVSSSGAADLPFGSAANRSKETDKVAKEWAKSPL